MHSQTIKWGLAFLLDEVMGKLIHSKLQLILLPCIFEAWNVLDRIKQIFLCLVSYLVHSGQREMWAGTGWGVIWHKLLFRGRNTGSEEKGRILSPKWQYGFESCWWGAHKNLGMESVSFSDVKLKAISLLVIRDSIICNKILSLCNHGKCNCI